LVTRDRLTQFFGVAHILNPVVLSGDIHSPWATDLKLVGSDAHSPIVGAEFVGSGITSVF
jgi:alkaline phosphatase D